MHVTDPPSSATSYENPPRSLRSYDRCRFSPRVADGDAPTWAFAEFSSKWRTRFFHLRGGTYTAGGLFGWYRDTTNLDGQRLAPRLGASRRNGDEHDEGDERQQA